MEWWEAIVNALRIIARHAKPSEIWRTVQEHELYSPRSGARTPTDTIGNEIRKRLVGHVHAHQDRHPKVFRQIWSGMYGLDEWGDSRTAPVFTDEILRGLFADRSSLVENLGQHVPEEVIEPTHYFEGAQTTITVTRHERDPKARAASIAHWGATCQVCEFDFAVAYGELGKGFIYVHHLIPLADVDEAYDVDPIAEMRPVCGNCHAMLHKRMPPLTLDELRALRAHVRGA